MNTSTLDLFIVTQEEEYMCSYYWLPKLSVCIYYCIFSLSLSAMICHV